MVQEEAGPGGLGGNGGEEDESKVSGDTAGYLQERYDEIFGREAQWRLCGCGILAFLVTEYLFMAACMPLFSGVLEVVSRPCGWDE